MLSRRQKRKQKRKEMEHERAVNWRKHNKTEKQRESVKVETIDMTLRKNVVFSCAFDNPVVQSDI